MSAARRPSEDATMFYGKWLADRAFLLVPAQAIVGEFLKTFADFPPRQRPASFSIDQALEKARKQQEPMAAAAAGGSAAAAHDGSAAAAAAGGSKK